MSYQEAYEAAKKHSDHHERVVEWEPAIRKALADTPTGTPVLEIGVQNGGSALLLMSIVKEVDPIRMVVTVDASGPCQTLDEWSKKLGLRWTHFKSTQADFCKDMTDDFAYVNFDADHGQRSASADIARVVPHLVKGAIVVKDDVDRWDALPEFEGMKRLDMDTPQGPYIGPHGRHCEQWQKL